MNSIIVTLLALAIGVWSEGVHWQWREMKCKAKDEKPQKSATPCQMALKETERDEMLRTAPFEPCFEQVVDGKQRTYCNVLCPGADTVYVIKRDPQNHRSCFAHFTYKLEKKGNDFFMWREGKCRTSDVGFTVRCEFAFSRADFPPDNVVFAKARQRRF